MQSEGQLVQVDDNWQVRFTRNLRHSPDKVWRALTEPERLAAWFPTEIIGERTDGAPLRFEFRNGEGPGFDGTMITCMPPRLLEFAWGEDVLRFELEPDGPGTVLTLTDTIGQLGKASRDSAGWHVCLERLDFALAGEAKEPTSWKTLNAIYVERFGPEASTIGPPEGHPEAS